MCKSDIFINTNATFKIDTKWYYDIELLSTFWQYMYEIVFVDTKLIVENEILFILWDNSFNFLIEIQQNKY